MRIGRAPLAGDESVHLLDLPFDLPGRISIDQLRVSVDAGAAGVAVLTATRPSSAASP